jgi:hypothetical protein
LCSLPFEFAIPETPTQAVINGPDVILTQLLRLSRDIAYHEIDILDALVSLPLQVAIPETPIRAIINGLDSFLIQWL